MKTINGIDIIATQEELNYALEVLGEYFTKEELEAKVNEFKKTTKTQQVKAEITQAIQNMLDSKAQELRYDNMMSARSYAGFENPFQTEAQVLAVWCANVWAYMDDLESDVLNGAEMPTIEQILENAPKFN